MEPVPVGVTGELYIGGEGVARGYTNRPELTAERFVPHPYSEVGGERLYRTGDIGRYRRDGVIEFVGRKDEQVKIRGYRIELGEIEAVMKEYGGVKQAVVEVREGEDGDKQLVGYVVREERERGQSWSGLRSYVGEKLPGYMVPGWYVELEELPLTENGKLDRKALRALGKAVEGVGGGGEVEYVGPRSGEEEIVCGIWEEVLKRERVGVEENFFEIGGHSLLATQVVSRIRQVFRVELGLRVMFEHPTVRGLAEQVQAERRAGGSSRGQRRPRLERREGRGTRMPLSFAQQRLWFLEQLEPGSGLYNVPFALRLSGELNREALQRSVQEIVRRHEVLRTRFVAENGEAVQEVVERGEVGMEMEVMDVRELGREEREERIVELAGEEAGAGFDLEKGPLLRVKLVKSGDQEHVLLATMHHIVSDGWSVGILVRELGMLYEAYGKGEESPLPELGIQYGDFAIWQREWLQGEVLEEEVGYWRKQLAGLERLELPYDYAREEEGRHRGGAVEFELGEELTWELKELSRREGVTLFMVLLGSLQVLLGRYTGQRDIAVGTPIANRNRLESEGLIGFFVNTLVLRSRLEWEAGFVEVLREVRRVVLEGYEHQDVPFEKLVEELAPERELGRNPLFDVMMVLQNAGGEDLELAGLRMTGVKQTTEVAKFDLNLGLEERKGGGLRGALNYARELFARETVEQMVRHWKVLLEGVVANPEGRIGALPLLSAEERRQQLVEWNRTERDFPQACVHELFEEQARRRGEAIAVVYEGEQVSYGELNRRANRLGRYLRKQGVGPEVAVGLCVERSVEMVVGILGVLKAGGAYVPLDPEYPGERLSYMVADAGVRLVLTQEKVKEKLPSGWAQVICLDDEDEPWAEEGGEEEVLEEAAGVSGQNLAYIIYTSGSTGKPKGVSITHEQRGASGAGERVWKVE